MVVKLYYLKLSPPVRAVLLTAKALDLDLELVPVDLKKGDHMTPEYVKMNPMHTVPVIDDDGFIVFDSHAINAYLVSKYGKTDALYPKDVQARAVVDQRLHFDSGILFPRLRNIAFPILFRGEKAVPASKEEDVREGYDFLDKLIGSNKWVAGDQMTIADCCCVASVATLNFMVSGLEDYPNLSAWLERCKQEMPGYEELNGEGVDAFEVIFKTLTA